MKTFGSRLIEDIVAYHVDNKIPLFENQMRPFSDSYFQLFREVRNLYREGKYEPVDSFEQDLLESDIGEVLIIDGKKVPLDHIIEEPDKDVDLNKPKAGGDKKYYVYVREPQTKNIKKVLFTYGMIPHCNRRVILQVGLYNFKWGIIPKIVIIDVTLNALSLSSKILHATRYII